MKRIFALTLAIFFSASLFAEEKNFELSPSVDLVSSYIWRGAYQTGVAIQPSMTASYEGISLSAWGSSDFNSLAKEIDFTLGYSIAGLGLSVSDYWWAGQGNPYFDKDLHLYEGCLSYSIGQKCPINLAWYTIFLGNGDQDENSNQRYSSYFEASIDFNINDVQTSLGIGLTPWKGMYANEFNVTSVHISACKNINITEHFALPLFGQIIFSPASKETFFVTGISF